MVPRTVRVPESVDLVQHAGRNLAALAAELMHPLYVLARSAMGALDLLFPGLDSGRAAQKATIGEQTQCA